MKKVETINYFALPQETFARMDFAILLMCLFMNSMKSNISLRSTKR